jgi:hypothetical protein
MLEWACSTTHSQYELWFGPLYPHFFRMLRIVQAQAPNGLNVLKSQRCQEQPDVGNLVRYFMPAEDIAA